MNDEIIAKGLTGGGNIPFADEDGAVAGLDDRGAREVTRKEAHAFGTFGGPSRRIDQEGRSCSSTVLERNASMSVGQQQQQRQYKRSPGPRRIGSRNEGIEGSGENPLQRYENAVLKYQRASRQGSRDRMQNHGCSSSDESVARNKSKSISSIDTQSVNNILDEYEDLDYGRSSDLSDVGSISVSNFEAVMMDQRKKQQQQERSRALAASRIQPKCLAAREKSQLVARASQPAQQPRQKESSRHAVPQSPIEDGARPSSCVPVTVDPGRARGVPEVLLRKGEVQKRVDEWLNQTQSQNFTVGAREKALTRSNSSADQKSQRRYRQDSRSRSIDEGRDKSNGTSSSYDDLSRAEKKAERKASADKVNVGVNTSRGTYKEYLASKNGRSGGKQQDYGFSASGCGAIGRTRDMSPSTAASRIPQRGPLGSSFRSRRGLDSSGNGEASQADNSGGEQAQFCQGEKNCRARNAADARPTTTTNLVKTRNESDIHGRISGVVGSGVTGGSTTSASTSSCSVIPCRKASFKRSQSHDQSAARPLVKEETGQRGSRGGSGISKGPANLGDQGEPISPNKDGESRRPALTTDSSRTAGDKPADVACKSIEAARSGADRPTRDIIHRVTGGGGESGETRRCYPVQDKRMDQQTRQEAATTVVYGAVGARVRTLQGHQESRVTKPRNLQAGLAPPEARKPPVLPRRDQIPCCQEGKDDRAAKRSPIGSPRSTFKPNSRVYAALQQLNEQNSVKSRSAGNGPADKSPARSHYSSPNHAVEKIYERSLQPQVIHVDDLQSILRPSLQVSAYGEGGTAGRSDRKSPPGEVVVLAQRNEKEDEEEEEEEEEEE